MNISLGRRIPWIELWKFVLPILGDINHWASELKDKIDQDEYDVLAIALIWLGAFNVL